MSFTLEISCKKCECKFDYIEVGIGSTHPVCLCSKCKHIVHPKRKLFRRGWFCRNCNFRQGKEDEIDLYRTPMESAVYKCPGGCGSNLDIKNYMHSLHTFPNSIPGKVFYKILYRASQYF